ncbi:hypothetical protein [Streptomyces sp. OM5714]|uniref:hypothetical protein n=1 Tax=Streptomyces sp. OM5714 TaxID=2602736 RepID=UPI0019F92344|nr:hypothetical protein [Streptomyces sp. OM5714]KAF2774648.1 hypothetical protein STPH1_7693 [Streptomyces sp. OM5714]
MSAQPPSDGDELRARAYLRALSARPFGHQDPAMHEPTPRPVTPTRVIPAGAPLPARPPEPDELPPWRTPPPLPPPVAPPPAPTPVRIDPDPGPVEIHHTHEVVLTWADPDPEPDPPLWARVWDWLWEHLVTWRMLVAILAALLPWLNGHSPVSLWAGAVHQARTEAGVLAAYVIAAGALITTWALDRRTGRAVPRFLLVTAALGALGVFDWWDPILALTGVHK